MKTHITVLIVIFGLLFSLPARSGDLRIIFEDLNGDAGALLFSLFDQEEGFLEDHGNAVKQGRVLLHSDSSKAEYIFKDLPNGQYALSVLHDANNNLEMDTGLLGIPMEGYGCSNNPRPLYRGPTFKECAFDIIDENISIIVKLLY